MMTTLRRLAAIAVAALGTMAVSCSGDAGESQTAATGSGLPGLHVTLQQASAFQNQRALQLGLRYEGDHDLEFGSVQLDSPLFEPAEAVQRDGVIRGGGAGVTMPLPYGEPRCDEETDGSAQLVTEIDGQEVHVTIHELPSGVLADLQAGECEALAVLDEVDVHLGDHWEHPAPRTAEGTLELTQRHPGVTASVNEVLGNVIFTVSTADPSDPWVDVSDSRSSASVPVTVYAARCDPHAIIEYKRTYFLTVRVQLGDDEPVRIDVHADGNAHRALERLLADCQPS
jgi:hypothetical protein